MNPRPPNSAPAGPPWQLPAEPSPEVPEQPRPVPEQPRRVPEQTRQPRERPRPAPEKARQPPAEPSQLRRGRRGNWPFLPPEAEDAMLPPVNIPPGTPVASGPGAGAPG